MQRKKFIISSLLIFCTWFGALPVSAQVKAPKPAKDLKAGFLLTADAIEAFGRIKKGDGIFSDQLTKMNHGDPDASQALEAQSVYFYDQLREQTKDQLTNTVERAREANKKRYDELKAKRGAVKDGPVRLVPPANGPVKAIPSPRRSALTANDPIMFRNAAYSPAADGVAFQNTQTANGAGVTGTETKSIDSSAATATRTANVGRNVTFDEKGMAIESISHDKTEAASKTDRSKITAIANVDWKVSFELCPDNEGVVRGTGQAHLYFQTVINTGRDIAALTSDTLIDIYITAYVNDAAEMTHFDITGKATEEMTGYDRALDHGIIDGSKGITDGKTNVIFDITNSTPPGAPELDRSGMMTSHPPVLGQSRVQTYAHVTEDASNRIVESCSRGIDAMMMELDPLMRSSMLRWKNQECVDVECTAPKTALKPGETIEVTATSISKQDMGRFNSPSVKAGGTQSVTPEQQAGTPSAVYTLTAPKEGTAQFVVTSTSRRGIGIGLLEIPVIKPKKPPVKPVPPKPKDCDAGWAGTIKAEYDESKEQEMQPSGGMTAGRTSKSEKWEVTLDVLGTRDTTGGIVNNYHANADARYNGDDYREMTYKPGVMGCDKTMITSPQTQKFDVIQTGDVKQPTLVTISVMGGKGYISFGLPGGVAAERTVVQKYESGCASYNAKNSFNEKDPRLVSVGAPNFEVEFQVDPANPNEIQGTKTVVEVDGSETTYSWRLTRACQ